MLLTEIIGPLKGPTRLKKAQPTSLPMPEISSDSSDLTVAYRRLYD
jgi:hypothetical protein